MVCDTLLIVKIDNKMKIAKLKKWIRIGFLSSQNPYKIKVIIKSLIEMQKLVAWLHLQSNLRHVIVFYQWRDGNKLWRQKLYFKLTLL